jgi:hypothetical protein
MSNDISKKMSEKFMNYVEKIERVKEKYGLESDWALAKFLNIEQTALRRLRKNGTFSDINKIKVMDKLAYSWARDALKGLLSESAYKKYIEFDKKITLKKIEKSELSKARKSESSNDS